MKIQKLLVIFALFSGSRLFAQTETDGLMMAKNNLCGGVIAGMSQWDHYWEGT